MVKKRNFNKKAIETQVIIWFLIAIVILVFVGYFIFFVIIKKEWGALEFIRNIFRFNRI
jgi:hypothetical protein